ncbi:unnamed protein product [Parascedosporium putredinis]|uniref:Zn(2)-C6 fungal-type domain-containing protein n=1 Tax=Parascedosporium putredinis TaxID=1442378 RepID=A0A9P1M8D1_9PEZI|nr:unnamed protein product [Parascedosporium putredinis]CAI7993393.1 unnamed protein product [Parascedosporium putredinis]
MDSSKWRVSKACQECRAKKIRCNGAEPCQRCSVRGLSCVYRAKARNRQRKVPLPPDSSIASSDDAHSAAAAGRAASAATAGAPGAPPGGRRSGAKKPEDAALEGGDGSPSIHIQSVAATHRASPGCYLELYYGPSSNFSMLHSIYHQMEGTATAPGAPQRDVEEVGPGLDKLGNRRIFFGDWADGRDSLLIPSDYSAMFLDRALSQRLIETYLSTYWHILPALPQTEYRRQLDDMHRSPGIFSYDSADNIIIILAMALGASVLDEEHIAEFLFQKAKQGAAKMDEVHAQFQSEKARPNASFLHTGTAVRKAVAAGMHKDVDGRSGQTQADLLRRRKTLWSLYFWETWICFSVGRPRSIPEPSGVPVPPEERYLRSLVALSRIMAKCASKIYDDHHQSVLPLWHAANEIRRELHDYAEQQQQDMNFGLVGDASSGELGPSPPPWLDTAAEYCLDAARHSIGFLTGACEQNALCQGIKYHGFFLEGACYVLAFDMLRARSSPARLYPSMPFGFDTNGPLVTQSPSGSALDEHIDLTAADMGWSFDLGTMDMDAFLSIDANQQFNFST